MKDGNIITFSLLLSRKGNLITELSGVPEKHLSKIFKDEDLQLVRTLLRLCKNKLEPLHKQLENELSALNHEASI